MQQRPAPRKAGVQQGPDRWRFFTTREFQPYGTQTVFLDSAEWRCPLGEQLTGHLQQTHLHPAPGALRDCLEENEDPGRDCGHDVQIGWSRIRVDSDSQGWIIEEMHND